MVSLIIEWVLFFLVLFFLVPAIMVFAMLMRDLIYQNQSRKQALKGPH